MIVPSPLSIVPSGRRLLATAVAVCFLGVSTPATAAAAPEEEVAAINDQAVEAFKNKEYEKAAELFKQAYELKPEPNYLFNIGRVYEQAGDMKNAVEFYTRFLRQPEVDLKAREVALERRRVLTAVLDETEPGWNKTEEDEPPEDEPPEDDGGAQDEPPPKETPPADEPPPEPKKPNKLRIAGYSLLGVGGAALIGGAVFAGVASSNKNELDDLNTLGARDDAISRGKRNALIADVLFLSGTVIALTGLTLVLVSLKKKPKASARATIAPALGPHGGGASAVIRF